MAPNSDQLLKMGRAVIDMQPFSKLMGAEITRFDTEASELQLDLKPEHLQQHGFAHGGVVSYMADNALTFAGGAMLGDVITVEFKINYQRPAKGVRLIARALSSGKRFATCLCEVFVQDEEGAEKLAATALGTIAKRS